MHSVYIVVEETRVNFKVLCISKDDAPHLVVDKLYEVRFINSMQVVLVEDYDEVNFQVKFDRPVSWASNFLFIEAAKTAVELARHLKREGWDVGAARLMEDVVKVVGLQ